PDLVEGADALGAVLARADDARGAVDLAEEDVGRRVVLREDAAADHRVVGQRAVRVGETRLYGVAAAIGRDLRGPLHRGLVDLVRRLGVRTDAGNLRRHALAHR